MYEISKTFLKPQKPQTVSRKFLGITRRHNPQHKLREIEDDIERKSTMIRRRNKMLKALNHNEWLKQA